MALCAVRVDADQFRGAALPVAEEDAAGVGRSADEEIRRVARERDVAAVERHRGGGSPPLAARVVPGNAVRIDAHTLGRARIPVVDEDVAAAVRVARHEIGRGAQEGDEPPVPRKGRPSAPVGRLGPGRVDAGTDELLSGAVRMDHGRDDEETDRWRHDALLSRSIRAPPDATEAVHRAIDAGPSRSPFRLPGRRRPRALLEDSDPASNSRVTPAFRLGFAIGTPVLAKLDLTPPSPPSS